MSDVDTGTPDDAVAAADNPAPVITGVAADEAYQLLPDGRILLAFEGKRFTLRRPRLGEFRHLRSLFLELATVTGEDQIDHAIKWVEESFAALADRPLNVPADDWPTWLVSGMPFGDWISHWREVPLAPGGPAAP